MSELKQQINSRNLKFSLITLMAVSVVGMHYMVSQEFFKFHIFLNMVHFLPLILSAFWFGIKGALMLWGGFALIYSPYLWLHLYSNTGELYEQILYSVLFLLVALLLGFLSDREKKMQKEKQQMARLAAMGEAISFISHEMKAPLVTIGGFTRQVRGKINNREMQQRMDLVLKETTRMEQLIRNMLDFAGPARVRLSPANLIQIVEDMIPVLENHSVQKAVNIHVDYPVKLPIINCDPEKIKQVFLNIAFNAVSVSPAGGNVAIQLREENNCIITEISDEGDGINEGDLNDIFSPFFTTQEGGTGLGLAISKKIVDAHQGEISIQKNQPRGVLVQIKLLVG